MLKAKLNILRASSMAMWSAQFDDLIMLFYSKK